MPPGNPFRQLTFEPVIHFVPAQRVLKGRQAGIVIDHSDLDIVHFSELAHIVQIQRVAEHGVVRATGGSMLQMRLADPVELSTAR